MTQPMTSERVEKTRELINDKTLPQTFRECMYLLWREIDRLRAGNEAYEKQAKIDADDYRALQKKRDYLEKQRKHWRDKCEKLRHQNDAAWDTVANLRFLLEGRDKEIQALKTRYEKLRHEILWSDKQ